MCVRWWWWRDAASHRLKLTEAGGSDVVDVVTAEARVGCDALAAVQAHRHVGLLAVLVHDVALGCKVGGVGEVRR